MYGNGPIPDRAPWFAWRSNLALADEVRKLATECGLSWHAAGRAGQAIADAPVSVAAHFARHGNLHGLTSRRCRLRARFIVRAILEGREDELRRRKFREWSDLHAGSPAGSDEPVDDHEPGDDENAWDDVVRRTED